MGYGLWVAFVLLLLSVISSLLSIVPVFNCSRIALLQTFNVVYIDTCMYLLFDHDIPRSEGPATKPETLN
jgi:hypothetical protein